MQQRPHHDLVPSSLCLALNNKQGRLLCVSITHKFDLASYLRYCLCSCPFSCAGMPKAVAVLPTMTYDNVYTFIYTYIYITKYIQHSSPLIFIYNRTTRVIYSVQLILYMSTTFLIYIFIFSINIIHFIAFIFILNITRDFV